MKQGDKYLSHIYSLSFSPEKPVQCGREKDVCFIHGLERKIIWFAKDFVLVKVTEQFQPSQALSPTQEIILYRKSPVVLEKPSYWKKYYSLNFAQFLKYFVPESVYHP